MGRSQGKSVVKEMQNKEISLIKIVDIVSSRFFTEQSCTGTVKWRGYRIPIILMGIC